MARASFAVLPLARGARNQLGRSHVPNLPAARDTYAHARRRANARHAGHRGAFTDVIEPRSAPLSLPRARCDAHWHSNVAAQSTRLDSQCLLARVVGVEDELLVASLLA
jgi:hypothetical protein